MAEDDESETLAQVEAAPDDRPPVPAVEPLKGTPVAAVGVDLRGQEALLRLFAAIERPSGAAWIVVARQIDGAEPARLAEELARVSGLPTEVVRQDVEPTAEHVYVAPADQLLTFQGGSFRLSPSEEAIGERGGVDSLLISLAENLGPAAVGVLLEGIGPDGSAGVSALKEHGGLAICERDGEAAGDTKLVPADPSGLADFILPVERIPERGQRYLQHLKETSATAEQEAVEEQIADQITRIAAILRNRTGHDFHGYKHNTFLRRIHRRMQVHAIDQVEPYIDLLRVDGDEVSHLFQDLLIGVTQFFRDRPEFEFLERQAIPKLFEGKGAGDHLRVWVLGCATGEEAYSIAILLREHMTTLDVVPHVQIFATDIDGRALTAARAGRYPESIAKDVAPERLLRWFTKEGTTYVVNKELREMCIFSQHNVIKDAPFSRIDLVSCRNLLIYLTSRLQDRLIPLFHFALRPGGYLFLGSSENVTRHSKLFAPADRQRRIFRRLETASRILPEFPLAAGERVRGGAETREPLRRTANEPGLGRQAERIAERYAPAYVLVDSQFDALNFSGRAGRFLEPAAGIANLNILNLVHRDLRMDLRAALQRAAADRTVVKIDRLLLDADDAAEQRRADIVIEPLPGDPPTGYVVLFRESGSGPSDAEAPLDASVARDEHVQRLEAELRLTRERLQATIEELESTNEELKSSNEEYQSINEELQSTNEELETSKEELQSVNEELHTVNGELGERVNELARANSDLKNLLESTQIATVFLDNDMRVKSFTPAMSEVFHLIDADIGRPLGHITARIPYPEMQDDIRRVLRTLSTVEREVGDAEGPRYHVRVLPYRSLENYIAGAVLTFLDVTETTKAQAELHRSEAQFRAIAELVPELLWSSNPDGSTDWFNRRWSDYTGQSMSAALGWGWLDAIHPDDRAISRERYEQAARNEEPFRREHRIRSANGQYRWFLVNAVPVRVENRYVKYYGAATDIDSFKQADDRQRLLLAELQHRVKNIMAVVRSISARSLETSDSLEEFAAHFSGRIDALARSQGVIARRGDHGVELEELVREELAASSSTDGAQVDVDGPSVILKEKAAEVFALALHELTTNAVKYGALSTHEGRVAVEWRVMNTSSGQRLSLQWRESGVRALDSWPARVGFGRDLIEHGLPYDLGATTNLDFAPGGVRCTVELPVSERVIAMDGADRPEAHESEEASW